MVPGPCAGTVGNQTLVGGISNGGYSRIAGCYLGVDIARACARYQRRHCVAAQSTSVSCNPEYHAECFAHW